MHRSFPDNEERTCVEFYWDSEQRAKKRVSGSNNIFVFALDHILCTTMLYVAFENRMIGRCVVHENLELALTNTRSWQKKVS